MSAHLSNLRPLVIRPEGVETPSARQSWLDAQPESVQRVTRLSPNGEVLYQVPVVDAGAYVDETAMLIGGMIISKGCYVGPYAVVRLDEKPTFEPLFIGEDSNIQDGAVIHSTTQHIGSRVIIAHQSIVHGARIEDDVTIYIQSVIDGNGTVIGRGTFIHQGAYVGKGIRISEGLHVPPGTAIMSQAEADKLHPVPPALLDVRAHVLEHNRGHVELHDMSRRLAL